MAANKATNKDGSWRARKGLNDGAMVTRIEAELRAGMAAPAASAAPLPALPAATVPSPALPAVPQPIATSPGSVAPVGTASDAPASFSALMMALGPLLANGRVSQQLVVDACTSVGVPNLPVLNARPDLEPSCWAFIRERAQL